MKEKCPLCGNDKEPTGMQLLCHPPITEMACRKCQPGKFPYIDFNVKRHDEAALKQSVWDGTGTPPVGVECEYKKYERDGVGTWWFGTVKYVSDCTVVIKTNGCAGETVGHPSNFEFRPIHSERDKAINEIASMIGRGTFYEDAERIYNAGYRKLSD